MNIEQYKVLYIGRDLVFQDKILTAFGNNYEIQFVRSTSVAAELIERFNYDVVLFDENILSAETYDGFQSTSIKSIYKFSIQKNIKAIFIYIYEKNSMFIKSFQKLSEATLFFKKDTITTSKLAYSLALLKRARYRSILVREIQVGKSYSVPFYFIDREDKNKKVFLEANRPIESNVLDLLKNKKMFHLFVKTEHFSKYIDEISSHPPVANVYAVKLNDIRKRVKKLLTYLSDDSTTHDFLIGGVHQKLVQEICSDLDNLINNFPDLLDAIEELPFPRHTLFNHCINTTIYALILNRICYVEHREHLAEAALIRDIGLSRTEYVLTELQKSYANAVLPSNVLFEDHIMASIEIITDKKLYLSPTVKDLILTHHELADGTGGPLGKRQMQLAEYQMLLPLIDHIDELRTSGQGNIENTFVDTFKKIIKSETNNDQFGKLGPYFNTKFVEQIRLYFNIE